MNEIENISEQKQETIEELNKNVKTRKDWELHEIKIRECYFKYLEEKDKIPTYTEIANDLGISYMTVRRHIEGRSFQDLISEFKPLSHSVVKKHYKEIQKKGNPQLIKTWYDVVENFKTNVDVSGNVQINLIPVGK
jgi:DNA-binding transcriptional regulator YhcF (GntR family)